ncbi:hypothetical protein FB451DRAFT_1185741 [Mycena latifolia]|nr:hypothetical protein FB451DRAFT_1185741 [Mycena latifolia]
MKIEEGFRQSQRVSLAEVEIGAGGHKDCRRRRRRLPRTDAESAACIGQIAADILPQRAAGVPQQSANLPQTSAADCRSNVFAAACLPQTAADCRSMNLYFMCPRSTAAKTAAACGSGNAAAKSLCPLSERSKISKLEPCYESERFLGGSGDSPEKTLRGNELTIRSYG